MLNKGLLYLFLSLSVSVWASTVMPDTSPLATQLESAIEAGDTAALSKLLREGLDPNCDIDGWPALVFAAKLDKTEIARRLIDGGADVNARNIFSDTALIVASYRQNVNLVRLLLSSGSAPDAKGQWGRSALWYAADKGNTAITTELLAHGAKLEARDYQDRETPLLRAVIREHPNVARLLLARGAKVNVTNKYCQSALQFAMSDDNKLLIKLLRKYGGKERPFCTTPEQVGHYLGTTLLLAFYLASVTMLPLFHLYQPRDPRRRWFRGVLCLLAVVTGLAGWAIKFGILEQLGLVEPTEPSDLVIMLGLIPPLGIPLIVLTLVAFALFLKLAISYFIRSNTK